jgi:hypothetical protein
MPAVVWSADPVLTVTEARRGDWTFTGLTGPDVVLEGESGCDALDWVFEWTAVPGDPERTVTDYRYGFDIVDLNDPTAWDIDWTPGATSAPPRTFYFGTHTFHVEARDNTGAVTRGSFVIHMKQAEWAPFLTIIEATRGQWDFVGMGSPDVVLTDPLTDPVTPWAFEWDAVACGGSNVIDASRYGWDIQDPGDDSQWSPWQFVFSAPPQEFYSGTHTFMVEVRDTGGSIARGTIRFTVRDTPVPVRETTWGAIKAMFPR